MMTASNLITLLFALVLPNAFSIKMDCPGVSDLLPEANQARSETITNMMTPCVPKNNPETNP